MLGEWRKGLYLRNYSSTLRQKQIPFTSQRGREKKEGSIFWRKNKNDRCYNQIRDSEDKKLRPICRQPHCRLKTNAYIENGYIIMSTVGFRYKRDLIVLNAFDGITIIKCSEHSQTLKSPALLGIFPLYLPFPIDSSPASICNIGRCSWYTLATWWKEHGEAPV